MSKTVWNNKRGFTLTEVLVGVLVLATSIVAASNLLVSMIHSNVANMSSLQAYYYTQEAMEAFRNMRDTHFMHNVNFCGQSGVNLFGKDGSFLDGCRGLGNGTSSYYAIDVNPDPSSLDSSSSGGDLSASSPWVLKPVSGKGYSDARVVFNEDKTKKIDTEFYRYCEVKQYVGKDGEEVEDVLPVVSDSNAIEVTCTTEWEEYSRDREVSLSMVLTNWRSE